jgi:hypothetical protein
MTYDLTPIINGVIALIAALITTFLIPWIKTKTTASKLKQWVDTAKIAVQAAEMIFNGVGRGEEKKAYVKAYLEERGITYDEETVNNIIESAVLELQRELTKEGG